MPFTILAFNNCHTMKEKERIPAQVEEQAQGFESAMDASGFSSASTPTQPPPPIDFGRGQDSGEGEKAQKPLQLSRDLGELASQVSAALSGGDPAALQNVLQSVNGLSEKEVKEFDQHFGSTRGAVGDTGENGRSNLLTAVQQFVSESDDPTSAQNLLKGLENYKNAFTQGEQSSGSESGNILSEMELKIFHGDQETRNFAWLGERIYALARPPATVNVNGDQVPLNPASTPRMWMDFNSLEVQQATVQLPNGEARNHQVSKLGQFRIPINATEPGKYVVSVSLVNSRTQETMVLESAVEVKDMKSRAEDALDDSSPQSHREYRLQQEMEMHELRGGPENPGRENGQWIQTTGQDLVIGDRGFSKGLRYLANGFRGSEVFQWALVPDMRNAQAQEGEADPLASIEYPALDAKARGELGIPEGSPAFLVGGSTRQAQIKVPEIPGAHRIIVFQKQGEELLQADFNQYVRTEAQEDAYRRKESHVETVDGFSEMVEQERIAVLATLTSEMDGSQQSMPIFLGVSRENPKHVILFDLTTKGGDMGNEYLGEGNNRNESARMAVDAFAEGNTLARGMLALSIPANALEIEPFTKTISTDGKSADQEAAGFWGKLSMLAGFASFIPFIGVTAGGIAVITGAVAAYFNTRSYAKLEAPSKMDRVKLGLELLISAMGLGGGALNGARAMAKGNAGATKVIEAAGKTFERISLSLDVVDTVLVETTGAMELRRLFTLPEGQMSDAEWAEAVSSTFFEMVGSGMLLGLSVAGPRSQRGGKGEENAGDQSAGSKKSKEKDPETPEAGGPAPKITVANPGKPIRIGFKIGKGMEHLRPQYEIQLKGQQDGFSRMSIAQIIQNQDDYGSVLSEQLASKAQADFRKERRQSFVETFHGVVGPGFDKEISAMLDNEFAQLAALHNPDRRGGGNADGVNELGESKTNSSIGSQWNHPQDGKAVSRAQELYEFAVKTSSEMDPETKESTHLEIELFISN